MTRLPIALLTSALLLPCGQASAYEERATSAGSEPFYARSSGSSVNFYREADALILHNDCSSGKRFYIGNTTDSCRCTKSSLNASGPQSAKTEVDIQLACPAKYQGKKNDTSEPLLIFTRTPSTEGRWTQSKATPMLAKDVVEVLRNSSGVPKPLRNKVLSANIQVWTNIHAEWQIVLAQTPPIINAEIGCKFLQYLILRKSGDSIEYLGRAQDATNVVSFKSHKLPLLQTETFCDGESNALRALTPELPMVSGFSGH
jgi:hypothetical protein